jgi:Holliday junction resolvasome RuvABC endonuclease subunit
MMTEDATPVVLALDQASSTGWAIADMHGVVLASGTKKFTGALPAKLVNFYGWLDELIVEHMPIAIAHEKPHFRGYNATITGVGFVTCISMQGFLHNLPVLSVHTATLKSFATGKGKARKDMMTAAASEVIGGSLDTKKDNDAADAIHIARWAVEELTKNQTKG